MRGIPCFILVFSLCLQIFSQPAVDGKSIRETGMKDCLAIGSDLTGGIGRMSVAGTALTGGITDTMSTHLPLVVIDTQGKTITNEPKITVRIKVIDNGPGKTNNMNDPGNQYDGYAGIEIRGQSSQSFPKKSYGFETRDQQGEDVKVSLMGMPEESDWVLYAPYSDKTLLRNALTYHLGSRLGRWQPRFCFCEVYLNGTYIGIYQLTEKIKRDKNRVNISKLEPGDLSENDITGGYILKVDKTGGLTSSEYFRNVPDVQYKNTRVHPWTWYYPKPEDLAPEQKTWFKTYIKNVENSINGVSFANPVTGYAKYLDIPSFIDFQIMNELPNNVDAYRFSAFFHKDRDSKGGKLKAGPLWDFDLGYGNVNYSPENLAVDQWDFNKIGPEERNCLHWWARMMEDPDYLLAVKKRWTSLRQEILSTDSIMEYIDKQVLWLGASVDRNFQKWPILKTYIWPNSAVRNTYSAEITYLKDWLLGRLRFMDSQWLLTPDNIHDIQVDGLTVYPNPFTNLLKIALNEGESILSYEIYDIRGMKIQTREPSLSGYGHLELDLSYLQGGIYLIRFNMEGQKQIIKKIVKR